MRTFFLLFTCAISIGCARLSVEIDILDPVATNAAAEEATLQLLYYRAVDKTPQAVVEEVELLRQQHNDAYEQLAKIYKEMADAEIDPGLKMILEDSAEDIMTSSAPGGALYPLYESLEKAIIASNEAILDAAKDSPLKVGEPIPPKLRAKLVARRDTDRDAKKPILQNLRAAETSIESIAKKEKKAEVNEEVQAILAPLENELQSIIGGPTLVGSEYAYSVVSAPEELWAPHFNHAVGKGNFGNTDIVIKMGGQGDFTVKGMQFDPSTVAAVASKVVTQSLLLAAQIAGVPVSAGDIQDTSKHSVGFAGTGDKVSTIDQKLAEREAKTKAWKAAIRDLSQSVLSEENSIVNGSDTDRIASGKALKAIYDAYKDTLKLNSLD